MPQTSSLIHSWPWAGSSLKTLSRKWRGKQDRAVAYIPNDFRGSFNRGDLGSQVSVEGNASSASCGVQHVATASVEFSVPKPVVTSVSAGAPAFSEDAGEGSARSEVGLHQGADPVDILESSSHGKMSVEKLRLIYKSVKPVKKRAFPPNWRKFNKPAFLDLFLEQAVKAFGQIVLGIGQGPHPGRVGFHPW